MQTVFAPQLLRTEFLISPYFSSLGMRNALEKLLRKSFKLLSQKGLSFARCFVYARAKLWTARPIVVLSKAVILIE